MMLAMSSMERYAPPAGQQPQPWLIGGDLKVNASRAFRYLFDQPDMVKLVLTGSVYMLIPLAGNFAVQGYGVRTLRHLLLTGDDRRLPPMGRLGDLIGIGIAPAAASMIFIFPVVFIAYFVLAAGMGLSVLGGMGTAAALAAAGADESVSVPAGIIAGGLLFIFSMLLFYAAILLASYPLQAIMTLVEVTGKIEYAWKMGDIRDFIRTIGKEYRRAFIQMQLRSMLVVLLGMLICYLGILPAAFILVMAGAHLRAQLYQVYLARGGRPYPMDPKR
jgi:hypothetical protein